jgi:hypothetical protein
LSLPGFVTAIKIFTSIIAIFHADTNDARTVQPYFTDMATILERQHRTATDGLVMVPIPALDLLFSLGARAVKELPHLGVLWVVDGQSIPYQDTATDDRWHGEIGAVDVYSVFGASGDSSSSPGGPPGGWPGSPLNVTPTTNAGNIISVHPSLYTLLKTEIF